MPFTTDAPRVIIDDFEQQIRIKKQKGPKPSKTVIFFRNYMQLGIEQDIYEVPIDFLRYRKDNGRIASDVISYERVNTVSLDESSQKTQTILHKFLLDKDQENTEILKKTLEKDGQTEPAIITCDGFLINGNRRKMAFMELNKNYPGKYKNMKVVILPGKNDEGGPPTKKEIELLENRYQLQKQGKSEYSGLDKALSIRRKMECGISLEEQIVDDPLYSGLTGKPLEKTKNDFEKKYLNPLQCVDNYLEMLHRQGLYTLITSGPSDTEGKWQAFVDYSNFYFGKLQNEKWRISAQISEEDIGDVQEIAFKIIRKQRIDGLQGKKLHAIIRDLGKMLCHGSSKKHLYKLIDISNDIDEDYPVQKINQNVEYSFRDIDKKWSAKNAKIFASVVNSAYSHKEIRDEEESPFNLLSEAYKKITSKNMVIEKMSESDQVKFCTLAGKAIDIIQELKQKAWERHKNH
jgi:hypothetical protein